MPPAPHIPFAPRLVLCRTDPACSSSCHAHRSSGYAALAKVHSPPRPPRAGRGCALVGLPLRGGAVVEVEADLDPRALPQVTLVGLPDAAVKD